MFGKPEEDMTFMNKLKTFLAVHYRGVVGVIAPIILIGVVTPWPGTPRQWCGYTILLMSIYWIFDSVPLAITSLLPIFIFPLAGVLTTTEVCKAYMNDTVILFLGSILLAYAVDQSGLHKRVAYFVIRMVGYSHIKLLLAMCMITCFVSMWVTNTAATTMMVPINFTILKVFDDQGIFKLSEKNKAGEKVASDITTAYFCAISYAATIGGVGTLIGTATNLAFKGLFHTRYPFAPEYLSFLLFSGFGIPYMIVMLAATYLIISVQYLGLLRSSSPAAKESKITPKAAQLANKAMIEENAKLKKHTIWQGMVFAIFVLAMICFFCRSPNVFSGWADKIKDYYKLDDDKFVRDSALAMAACFLMLFLFSNIDFINNFKAKFVNELPTGRIPSVLDWSKLNAAVPFSFMFVLGSGFALSEGAFTTGLIDKIGEPLKVLKVIPNIVLILFIIIIVIFITNFASNVAVANVIVPIAMQLGREVGKNPLWYCIAAGFSASFAFMNPTGTPGNYLVHSVASIPPTKMMKAGLGPTLAVIIISWIFISFYAPIIWPDLNEIPAWVK